MKQEPIAIVGMACRLPGANDIDEFWNLVSQGRSAIAPVPEDRLDRRLYYDPKVGVVGRTYSDKAALVDYSDATTPDGCITEKDIRSHDTAHVTLCRVVDQAMAHAGQRLELLQQSRTGVFFGHAACSGLGSAYVYAVGIPQIAEYLREVSSFHTFPPDVREHIIHGLTTEVRSHNPWRTREQNPHLAAGDAAQMVASKFRLNGPNMVFNSACASSLQAIGHAMKSLQLGRIDAAVAGGASFLHSDTLVLFSAAQSLSADGSWPFTQQANGLIAGEGYVVFLLKTLKKAIADKDRIYAVLSGVGISSDGRGKSLWAPLPDGQVHAMRRGYDDPADFAKIEYIEGHFTSTHLGDKTEIQSITQVLQEFPQVKKRIPVGSVKGNIGHCLEVAGAAGLLKVVLALQNNLIPSAVDPAMPLNKDVDWKNVPVFPPSKALPWMPHDDGTPRRSGVNAFGIGGLNVHLAVEEYVSPQQSYPAASVPAQQHDDDNAVAIVGSGMILPSAIGQAAFHEMLHSQTSGIRSVPIKPWDARLFSDHSRWGDKTVAMPGAGIIENFEYDWKTHGIPPKQLAQASPLQFMILEAVDQALQEANYDVKDATLRMATGCIVGTSFGGDFSTQLILGLRQPETCELLSHFLKQNGCAETDTVKIVGEFQRVVLKHIPALIDETGSFTSSALASRITKSFDFKGGGVAVEASDVSAFAALLCCIDMLLTGANDVMICIAGQHDLTPGAFHELALIDRIAKTTGFAAPYDANAHGTLPGEGCVAFVLKRLPDARRDGDRILGIIQGIGAAKNHSIQQAVRDAVAQARQAANVDSDKIRAFAMAGLGMAEIDNAELHALDACYPHTTGKIPAATSVGQFGHLGAASGFVSMLSALIALDDQTLHPSIAFSYYDNNTKPDNIILSNGPQKVVTYDPEGKLYVGINHCSEFGNNYHIILQRGTPVIPEIYPSASADTSCHIEQISLRVFHFDATTRRKERLRTGMTKPIPAAPVPVEPMPVVVPSPVTGVNPDELEKFLVGFIADHTGYMEEIIGLDEQLYDELGIDDALKAELFGEITKTYGVSIPSNMSPDGFATLRSILDYLSQNAGVTQPKTIPSTPVPTTSVAPVSAPPVASANTSSLDAQELEAFLVKFVVDQTGYPEEHVTLDVDLEDGLSIDSIKKAQLFGELGEFFDIRVSGDVTLDDFTTLRHVLDFLLANGSPSGETAPAAPAAPISAPVPTPATTVIPPAQPAPVPASAPATTSGSTSLDAQELEAFLVKFVVDQTGYPEEHVTLDVDLEDGLSIDSIKKAQLFGELGEFFDIRVSGDVTLDDFTTLRHVLDFILANADAKTA